MDIRKQIIEFERRITVLLKSEFKFCESKTRMEHKAKRVMHKHVIGNNWNYYYPLDY